MSMKPGMQSVAGSKLHVLFEQCGAALKNWQTLLHMPQLLTSSVRSNVSSTLPSQLLSIPSQASTPPLLWKHWYSQPSEMLYGPVLSPFLSVKPGKQPLISPAPAVHFVCAPALLQALPHTPQFFESVCVSNV